MKRKIVIESCCIFLFAIMMVVGGFGSALAGYPDKPITYIIPFNPGGISDVTARLQQIELEKILGVKVNVVHKPGGGGAVGWAEFQRTAKPDGYTIIGVNIPHIIAQPLQRKDAGYTTHGFEPIIWFHRTPVTLIVQKEGNIKTLADFIQLAKSKPGAVTVGGSGSYSATHLELLRFAKQTGIQVTYVPNTGTGPLIPALMGGHFTSIMDYSMVSIQYKEKFQTLAVSTAERLATMPDVPTFKELGYDIVGGAYRGIAVPKGTPPEITKTLTDAFVKTNDIIADKQREMGFEVTNLTGQQAEDLLNQMETNYTQIILELEKTKKK